MSWFKATFGAEEPDDYADARAMFEVVEEGEDTVLVSKVNSARFGLGTFETLSIPELMARVGFSRDCGTDEGKSSDSVPTLGKLRFSNIVDDVRTLHHSKEGNGAVFQVASQFNLLEMVGPGVRPEDGVTRYAGDPTQGPACALSCPAGTVYRNYLCRGGKGQGGGQSHQLNMLEGVEMVVDNATHKYWRVQNGYALPVRDTSLATLEERLSADSRLRDAMCNALKVGIHWNTQVGTTPSQRVCQVYCSALPVSYTRVPPAQWTHFALTILRGAFTATLAAGAVLATRRRARVPVYLTCLGGGAFGNPHTWIVEAIHDALRELSFAPLDVYLVHFRGVPSSRYTELERAFAKESKEVLGVTVVPTAPSTVDAVGTDTATSTK